MTELVRYVGLDVHKKTVMIAAVDSQQNEVMPPYEIAIEKLGTWACLHLTSNDWVALEATSNAWEIHDQLAPLVAGVKVANAHKVKLISSSRVKTDKHDAQVLAKLLAANLLPDIWVPPVPVRELRGLVAHRFRLCRDRSAARNRLHSVLHRHNILLPEGDPFAQVNQVWWESLDLSSSEKLRIRHELLQIQHLNGLLDEVEFEIAQMSVQTPWVDQVAFLLQLPGVGLNSAMTILSAIGDIQRFPTAKQLVGYSGLGSSVPASGQTYRTGNITKLGRRELRATLIECAWVAVTHSKYWASVFDKLKARIGKQKAITAVARKILVAIWHVLSKRASDRHTDVDVIARSLMRWASTHRLATSMGMKRYQFVWRELDRLGLGQQMETFSIYSHAYGRQRKKRQPISSVA